MQPTTRRNQREATLVLGEIPTEVAAQEERAQGVQLLRAVAVAWWRAEIRRRTQQRM